MKVALMQPTFLPWLGYFELMTKADVFVFLDDFQFVYQSYHQRNRLFTNQNTVQWITCPINKKVSLFAPLNRTIISENGWRRKLWRTIENNYKKTPFFSVYSAELYSLLLQSYENLAIQNMTLIRALAQILGIHTELHCSSEHTFHSKRSALVYEILKFYETDTYFSAHGSFGYMKEDGVFPVEDIEVLFQNAVPEPYPQIGSKTFVPYLSVLDALFNVGAERTKKLIENMTSKWLSWNEMLASEGKNDYNKAGGNNIVSR